MAALRHNTIILTTFVLYQSMCMKRIGLAVLFIGLVASAGFSQKTDDKKDNSILNPIKKLPKPKKQDVILFNFNWMTMLNAPKGSDGSMWISPFSRGFDVALMYDVPLGRSPISFAAGVNFSFENIFVNHFINDSVSGGTQYVYTENIENLINVDNPPTKRDWNKAKLATGIVELPIEFRYRMKPHKRNTFKVAVGFKIGYVIDSWQKYNGPNYLPGEDLNTNLRQVTFEIPAVNRLRYGVYGRIGYSRFNAYVHYSISPFFMDQIGPNTGNVFTVGFNFSPF